MLIGVCVALLSSILMGVDKYPVWGGIGLVVGIFFIFKGRGKIGLPNKK
jgi:hypothetical protein